MGAATVLPGAIARGGLTALLWFWTPPVPLGAVATVDDGLRFCFRSLADAKRAGEPARGGHSPGVLDVLFVDEFFPLLVTVHAARLDESELGQLIEGHHGALESDRSAAICPCPSQTQHWTMQLPPRRPRAPR